MKKTLKWSSVIVLLIFCLSNFMSVGALTIVDSKLRDQRLQSLFQYQLNEMLEQEKVTSRTKASQSLTISKTKEIKDFDGNQFILVELAPTGYMIYHVASGIFVEHAVGTSSPYAGYEQGQELYYAGPNEYYFLNPSNHKYEHTIFDEYIDENDLQHNQKACRNMNDALEGSKDEQALNFVNKNEPIVRPMGSEALNGFYYINGYTFFSKLNQCGYISGGVCGYIALGMLLAYHRALSGRNSCPAEWVKYTKSGSSFSYSWIDSKLATKLQAVGKSIGIGNSTYPWNMNDITDKYLKGERGYAASNIEHFSGTTNQMIAHHLKKDRPMIWFGNITSNSYNSDKAINHAVVVYAYKSGLSYSYIAHFGWNNATAVTFSGVLGGYYSNSLTK